MSCNLIRSPQVLKRTIKFVSIHYICNFVQLCTIIEISACSRKKLDWLCINFAYIYLFNSVVIGEKKSETFRLQEANISLWGCTYITYTDWGFPNCEYCIYCATSQLLWCCHTCSADVSPNYTSGSVIWWSLTQKNILSRKCFVTHKITLQKHLWTMKTINLNLYKHIFPVPLLTR